VGGGAIKFRRGSFIKKGPEREGGVQTSWGPHKPLLGEKQAGRKPTRWGHHLGGEHNRDV